jgi:HlyD family secretion protein
LKTFLIILVTSVIVGGMSAGIFFKMRGAGQGDETVVRLEPASRGVLIETVTAPGVVEPKTKVSISAKTVARIIELPFDEGDVVTKGDPNANPPVPPSVLVRLDSKDLEALLRGAEARYAGQSAQIVVAEARITARESELRGLLARLEDEGRELDRQNKLLETKDVSQSVVDNKRALYEQTKAQVESSQRGIAADRSNLMVMRHEMDALDAEVARARENLSYAVIHSPIDGIVTKLNAEVGELVVTGTMNNEGTIIMEVADLGTMLAIVRTDESSIAQLKVGQRALVHSQAYQDDVFEGTVSSVALDQTEEKDGTRYYETEVLLKTDGKRIFAGLTADVDIETARHEKVLKVPSQAVLGRPLDDLPQDMRDRPEVDKNKTLVTVVYRFLDGKALVTPVKVGASDITHSIIESGLNEGDVIIVGPYKVLEGMKHDQKVKDEKTVPATQPKG